METPGGLCENVLAVKGDPTEYPCFEITDLSKDPRFAELSVIDGTIAAMRFYAGTPITTQHGVNIGSFFMFDDVPRPEGLSLEERKTLFTTAASIMRHLEAKREAVERRRIALMSSGVARFLEKANELTERNALATSSDGTSSSAAGNSSREEEKSSNLETPDLSQDTSTSQTSTVSISNDGGADDEGVGSKKKGASEIILGVIRKTLDHAAEILRSSLELSSGGVVFFDTAIRYAEPKGETDYFETKSEASEAEASRTASQWLEPGSAGSNSPDGEDLTMTGFADMDPRMAISPGAVRGYHDENRPARVLAMSASKHSYKRSKILNGKTLNHFINEYPKGNVWYIDDKGYFSSLDQMEHLSPATGQQGLFGRKKSVDLPTLDLTRQAEEASLLSQVFPKARQIIFLPLWDARGNRWHSGCFVFSNHAFPVFTVESELSYVSALSNSVMVEISRLDSIVANNMKSDFISSISHEFRSPLHGILASAEFLQDSELDQTQKELVSTIQTCGSTLLDTINHVLDYSKINSFEKKKGPTGAISNELDNVSNVALLCEDIVCGVMAARNFGVGDSSGRRESAISQPTTAVIPPPAEPVTIILDFENRDWNFLVQPGALRRIALNLIGNAQKYTERGFILVQLRAKDKPGKTDLTLKPNQKMLVMNIIDSGRGMSTTFLERRMGQPFSQENSFAPGIGLGMAIVKSIVAQLGGKINVRSELGKGTDVEVLLPLEIPTEHQEQQPVRADLLHHRNSAGHGDLNGVQSVLDIRQIAPGKTVAFWRRTDVPKDRNKDLAWKSVMGYCKTWYGFTILDGQDPATLEKADLVLKEFSEEDESGESAVANLRLKRVLFLQQSLSALSVRRSTLKNTANILMPVGPFRLARIIGLLFPGSNQNSPWDSDEEIDPLQRLTRNDSEITVTNSSNSNRASDNVSPGYNPHLVPNGHADTTESLINNHGSDKRHSSEDSHDDLSPTSSYNTALSNSTNEQFSSVLGAAGPLTQPSCEVERKNSEIQVQGEKAEAQWADSQLNMLPTRPHSAMGGGHKKPKRPSTQTQTSLPPLTTISAMAPGPNESTNGYAEKVHENRPLHILAVDDNSLNLKLLTRYLAKRPCDTVVTARNGVEAVAAVRRAHELGQNFDVIFMDISMPTMDGFEATRLIRAWERDVRNQRLAETLKLPTSITRILSEESLRRIVDVDIIERPETRTNGQGEGEATNGRVEGELEQMQGSPTIKIPIRGLSGTPLGHVVVGKEKIIEKEVQKTVQELHEDQGAFIVALTGLASRRDRDEAVTSGFDDFMTKPISFGMIGELLENLSRSENRRIDGRLHHNGNESD